MPPTVANAVQSKEVRSVDSVRPRAAKADLRKSDGVGSHRMESDFRHGPKIWDALVKGHGSVNATAITMEDTDPTQLKREVTSGSIRLVKLFTADEAALCDFAEYVLGTFKPALKSPRQRAIEKVADMQKQLADLQLALGLEDE